ncbi:unnamed protein product [Phaeothamnion confervicola]
MLYHNEYIKKAFFYVSTASRMLRQSAYQPNLLSLRTSFSVSNFQAKRHAQTSTHKKTRATLAVHASSQPSAAPPRAPPTMRPAAGSSRSSTHGNSLHSSDQLSQQKGTRRSSRCIY